VLMGTSCRCSPLVILKIFLIGIIIRIPMTIPTAEWSYPSLRTTNHMSILNLATPSVGVTLGVQVPSSGFESFINSGLASHSGHHATLLTCSLGRTPRIITRFTHALCVLLVNFS
jgi:hypothetical protein